MGELYNPSDVFFHVHDDGEVSFCPIDFWNENESVYDEEMSFSADMPPYYTDGVQYYFDGDGEGECFEDYDPVQMRKQLLSLGFKESAEMSQFIESCEDEDGDYDEY